MTRSRKLGKAAEKRRVRSIIPKEVMLRRRRIYWATALGVIACFCAWTAWCAVSWMHNSSPRFGIGLAETAQMRIWYPAPPSALGRLRAAVSMEPELRTAPLAGTPRALPVLIYFGGWPGTKIDNRELIGTLVGEGFVVVAGPDTAESAGQMDFSSAEAFERTLQRANARVQVLAEQAIAMLDSLQSLNQHDPTNRFTGRLDLGRVGILGYSFGGAVAAQAAWRDPRFKAVLNLDGWSFGESAVEGIRQPYLFISDDTPLPSAADLASPNATLRYTSRLTNEDYPRLLHNLARHAGTFVVVEGTAHDSFVDRGRRSRALEMLGFSPRSGRVQQILGTFALAFFRRHLEGIESPLLSGPSRQFPEVEFRGLEPAS